MPDQRPRFHGLGPIVAGALVALAVLSLAVPIWSPPLWFAEQPPLVLVLLFLPLLIALVGVVLLFAAQARIWGLATQGSLEPPRVKGFVTIGIVLVLLGIIGYPILFALMGA